MMKLKLQLFALDPNSIVDYINSQGGDSSLSARKKIAESLGIANYTGTAEQNTQMLKAMKSGGMTQDLAPSPGGTSNGANKNVQGNNANGGGSTIKGVDDKTSNTLKNGANATNIINQSTLDIINSKFKTPSGYDEAMAYTNSLLAQLSTGRTSYSDQVDAMIQKIQNREEFEYDVDQDALFQQALSSAMASGKTAMQDTIGQASALTGGYASTYATTAGNNAYNAYIQDAYNNLPEYYQMAMQAYQMEGEDMYNQLGMLNDADNKEYERLYNAWSANYTTAQDMYQNAYTEWSDSVNHALSSAGLQIQESNALYDRAYNYANLLNNDYWKQTTFDEDVRQYNTSMAQRQSEFNTEMDYKERALQMEADQYDKSLAQDKYEFEQSLKQKKDSSTGATKTFSDEQYNTAKKHLDAGDKASFNLYLNSLLRQGYSEEDVKALAEELKVYANENDKGFFGNILQSFGIETLPW